MLFPPSVEYALVGIPRSYKSQILVVDAVNGNNSNPGSKWDQPLAGIEAAYAKTIDLRNDVILLVGNGTSNQPAAALSWAHNFTHLIGLNSGGPEPRSRIKSAAALATTPFITIGGGGCVFRNISFWHETSNAAGLVNVSVTGERNRFEGCQFAGGIGANALTGARSLMVAGSGNSFKDSVIGNDTIMLPDGAAGIEFDAGAMHTVFDDCDFLVNTNGTTFVHVLVPTAADVGRFNKFRRCLFVNEGNGVQASVFGVVAALPVASSIFAVDCWKYGVTKWDASNNGLMTNGEYPTSISGINTAATLLKTSG